MSNKQQEGRASIRLTPADQKIISSLGKKLAPKWEPRKPTLTDIFRVAIRELDAKEGVSA